MGLKLPDISEENKVFLRKLVDAYNALPLDIKFLCPSATGCLRKIE
jgi:hypothetical protein